MPATKKFVLDTSVLLYSANSLHAFGKNDVILPYAVLDELDKFKSRDDSVGVNARRVARELNELRKEASLSDGVVINPSGGLLRVELNFVSYASDKAIGVLDLSKNDDRILNVCLGLQQESSKDTDIILVTKDINLAVRADVLKIKAQDYDTDRLVDSVEEMYTGSSAISVPDNLIDDFYGKVEIYPEELGIDVPPNHYITLVSEEDPNKTALGRVVGQNLPIQRLRGAKGLWGIRARNREQQFVIDALLDPSIKLLSLSGAAGVGKAQPLDSLVLTPSGYVSMGSLSEGDAVSTPDGSFSKITGVFPQGNLDIYRVEFSDGTSTECCNDHLWETRTELDRAKGRRGTVKTLGEIRETLFSRENLGTPRSNHSIPMTKPVNFVSSIEVPLDPYCLGLLLGDGGLSHPSTVYFSTADEELALALCAAHADTTLIKCKGSNYDYRIIRNTGKIAYNPVKEILKELELFGCTSENKFIPHVYKWSSVANRVALLQGLMDTDGTVDKRGTAVTYTTVSQRLAEDIKFLVESIGGKVVIRPRTASYTYKGDKKEGKLSYRLFLSFPPDIIPFKLTRKIDRHRPRSNYPPTRYIRKVEKTGKKEAQCIMIDSDDHLYMTNNFIVTHNTLLALAGALQLVQETEEYTRLVVSRPVQPMGRDIGFLPGDVMDKMSPWMGPVKDSLEFLMRGKDKSRDIYSEMIGLKMLEVEPLTYIRGRSMPNIIFILDEAQDMTRPEIKTLVSRMGEGSKLVLIGDVMQISNPYLDSTNNGLSNVIEKFKPYNFSAHITLTKGERSELATVAGEIL